MGIEAGAISLMGALAMIPIVGFAAVWLIQRMVAGDLEFIPGVLGFTLLLGMFALAILVPDNRMLAPVMVILVSAMAYFPFAESQLEKFEHVGIDTSRIDKAHQALAARSDNIPARFELARALYDRGLKGHAIALAENTLAAMPSTGEPLGQPSLRDKFRSEEYMVKQWRRDLRDPRAFDPVKCRACNFMNPPGTLECQQCKGPYLLELARSKDSSKNTLPRVFAGFVLTATLLVVCAMIGVSTQGVGQFLSITAALVVVGLLLTWIYRPRTLKN